MTQLLKQAALLTTLLGFAAIATTAAVRMLLNAGLRTLTARDP
jgi:hypothetical protein